ncbi:hypothetical protein C8R43DRAFT_952766 [Mycena crocata]|nr:hypothetical protein C8R43DRAFT_952766 [Mycena crocata]
MASSLVDRHSSVSISGVAYKVWRCGNPAFIKAPSERFRYTEPDTGSTPQRSSSPEPPTETSHPRNVLASSLKTLSTVSSNITFGAILSSVLDPLHDIVDDIEQTSANKEGLAQLAARVELLAPTVSNIANNDVGEETKFAKDLERLALLFIIRKSEFESITKDLCAAADEQGHFDKFFGNTDVASSLAKHNSVLDKLIAEFRSVDVQEVLGAVEWEFSKLLQFTPSGNVDDAPILPVASSSSTAVLEHITGETHPGGVGGAGGSGEIGGQGGHGEGPKVNMNDVHSGTVKHVSGGTGGAGGDGVKVGGQGGTGRAPNINMAGTRRNDI